MVEGHLPASSQMTDQLKPLIAKAQAGDQQALNQLSGCVDRFVRIFHGSLSRRVRVAYGSTIDFVLEGLAEAMAHLGELEYRSDEDFYAWAAAHIRHQLVDAARHEGRKKRAGHPAPLADSDDHVAAAGPTPSEAISEEEMKNAVGHALLELQVEHPQETEAVLLKVHEGRSWPEIQELMGLTSVKRARTLFARGVDLIRPRVARRRGKPFVEDLLGR
jgi:RNA polymerase sigma factor (sigma-70 family)